MEAIMSAENVQIIHGMYQAFARGDVQAVIVALALLLAPGTL
jgi:hypothetical protein